MKNTTVILRSAGERTEQAALALLKELTTEIIAVKTAPFSLAVKECFEKGIMDGKEWTLVIDADVLISRSAVIELTELALTLPPDTFCVQGLVFDKLFSVFRPAGNHLFRTSLLNKAVDKVAHNPEILRPESYVIDKMTDSGYRFIQTDITVGVHDYEQSYPDIARKAFLHGKKHCYLTDILTTFWKARQNDLDMSFAMEFFQYGAEYAKTVRVDYADLSEAAAMHSRYDIEKPPFDIKEAFGYADRVISVEMKNLYSDSARQDKIFPRYLWNSIQKGKKRDDGLSFTDAQCLETAKTVAVFGLGKSGRMTLDFLDRYFEGKTLVIIDDNEHGYHNGIQIVDSIIFVNDFQNKVDMVVCGRYQKISPELTKHLKIPLLRLNNIC